MNEENIKLICPECSNNMTFYYHKIYNKALAEVEKMIDRCFLKENLLIDNIIQTGKTIIGTKADVKFMKNYKLELLELECEFAEELHKLKENQDDTKN